MVQRNLTALIRSNEDIRTAGRIRVTVSSEMDRHTGTPFQAACSVRLDRLRSHDSIILQQFVLNYMKQLSQANTIVHVSTTTSLWRAYQAFHPQLICVQSVVAEIFPAHNTHHDWFLDIAHHLGITLHFPDVHTVHDDQNPMWKTPSQAKTHNGSCMDECRISPHGTGQASWVSHCKIGTTVP